MLTSLNVTDAAWITNFSRCILPASKVGSLAEGTLTDIACPSTVKVKVVEPAASSVQGTSRAVVVSLMPVAGTCMPVAGVAVPGVHFTATFTGAA